MKQRVFVDTNIVLDLLLMRKSFYKSAMLLFSFAERKKLIICISALTFTTVHYILSKHAGAEKAKNVLSRFKTLITVLSVDDNIIDHALASDFRDFEDAVQYYCAVSAGIAILLTRDIKDYHKANISVMSVEEFLKK
jgi:predicted nucleic acid-binding protein